jgi:hypothetical protein
MAIGIYIDPGKHYHACAAFIDDVFSLAYFFPTNDVPFGACEPIASLIVEKPQVYPGADEKNPNDLLEVYGAARFAEGIIRARGGPAAHYVLPREWKGSFKKPPHHRQVWAALTPPERAAFAECAGHSVDFIGDKIEAACQRLARTREVSGYSWKAHNLLDAVGLGLWHHRRLRGRVAPPPVAKV